MAFMSKEIAPGLLEGQVLSRDAAYDCDVCIVGSGAGGAVAAATLQRAGLKVIVLEEGGYFARERFRMNEEEAFRDLYQEGGALMPKDASVLILQGKAVGGTTVVNWTTSFRTPASVLERWRTHHAVHGVTHDMLQPHFEAIEERLSIGKVPLDRLNRNNRLLYDGCRTLGYHIDTIPRNVNNCAHLGYCGMGCPIDAKQSMLVSYLPDAMEAGATVISRCRVDRLVSKAGRIASVEGTLLDASGRYATGVSITVRAKHFILSAGAIGSPGILLRSGLPDPHGRAGLRTFIHPVVNSLAEYPDPVEGFYGAPQSVASHEFYDRGDEVGFLLEAVPVHPGLFSSAAPGIGDSHRAIMERMAYTAVHLALTGDGLHDDVPGGRVELRRDGSALLDYRIAPRTWRALRDAQKILARIQLAGGAKRVVTFHDPAVEIRKESEIKRIDDAPFAPGRMGVFSAHVMGGAGMSDDPAQGVVRSEDVRHHQVPNLHVIDGSVFPTGLGVNPQESIYGIAHLMASRLREAWT